MNSKPGIFGKKIGMTQLYKEDGTVQRVTVVDVSSLQVIGKRTKEKDGYTAVLFGIRDAKDKHLTKANAGNFKTTKDGKTVGGIGSVKVEGGIAAKRVVKELRCDEEFAGKFEIGAAVNLADIFQPGQIVDAQGTTRGRGFSGVVRRWSMAGGVQTHGTHEYRRHGGSIGTNMTPGRTLPGLKMPGQYGNETVTAHNLKIAKLIPEDDLVLIEGAVPGPKNQLVTIRGAIKKKNAGKKA